MSEHVTVTDQTVTEQVAVAVLPTEPDPAQRPARLALYLGLALLLGGGVVVYLGYNGAATAQPALVQAQIPYIISGGLFGLGLMGLGGIALALHVMLRVQADLRTELRALRDALETGVGAAITTTPNGTAGLNGRVVATPASSSFHRPDCRLVARAERARPMGREEAAAAGLIACRICKP